jgi:hypothetical protein
MSQLEDKCFHNSNIKPYQQNHRLMQHDFDRYAIFSNSHAEEHVLQQHSNLRDQPEKDVQVQDDN